MHAALPFALDFLKFRQPGDHDGTLESDRSLERLLPQPRSDHEEGKSGCGESTLGKLPWVNDSGVLLKEAIPSGGYRTPGASFAKQ